jgi:hypothetical protein
MNDSEWAALQRIDTATQSLHLRFIIIEEQVNKWRNRDKWLGRLFFATALGFAVWILQRHCPV